MLSGGACAYTFDEAAADVTLVGDPVPKEAYQKLNEDLGPARTAVLVQGPPRHQSATTLGGDGAGPA